MTGRSSSDTKDDNLSRKFGCGEGHRDRGELGVGQGKVFSPRRVFSMMCRDVDKDCSGLDHQAQTAEPRLCL